MKIYRQFKYLKYVNNNVKGDKIREKEFKSFTKWFILNSLLLGTLTKKNNYYNIKQLRILQDITDNKVYYEIWKTQIHHRKITKETFKKYHRTLDGLNTTFELLNNQLINTNQTLEIYLSGNALTTYYAKLNNSPQKYSKTIDIIIAQENLEIANNLKTTTLIGTISVRQNTQDTKLRLLKNTQT